MDTEEFFAASLWGRSCTITVHSFRSADTRKSLNGVDISRALRWYNLVQLYTHRFARVTYPVVLGHVFNHAFYPLRCCPMSRGLCICADPYCHRHTSWRDYHSIHYRDSLNHSAGAWSAKKNTRFPGLPPLKNSNRNIPAATPMAQRRE
ncbi:hypothetical protein IG631_10025 [Alternaria alternata]|nr:hypothetical protein IG631_10025 [Alternaria alternata]